jgi:hypothetical protein
MRSRPGCSVTDQRAPQQQLGGGIDRPPHVLLQRLQVRGATGLGRRIRVRTRGQPLHKLLMKRRPLRAERLIVLGVGAKQTRDRHRYLVLRRGHHLRRRARSRRMRRSDRRSDPSQILRRCSKSLRCCDHERRHHQQFPLVK